MSVFSHRRVAAALLTLGVAAAASACGSTADTKSDGGKDDGGKYEIVLVSKIEGIPWFQTMAKGVDQFDQDFGDKVEARQTGPDTADAAKQIQIVEDLIAQQVDAIVIVPTDPNAVGPVLKKARDAGIVVVTHEAPALAATESVDYDVEAFDNAAFGEQFADALADSMGGSGEYATEVGALTMETHVQWVDAFTARIAEAYPDMEAVATEPYEDNNDEAEARANAEEILRAHPELKGFFAVSGPGATSFAQVVQEKGIDGLPVVGVGLPSQVGPYLEDGSMTYAQAWSPASAGYASSRLALQILEGEDAATGVDLGQEGYGSMTVEDKLVIGEAILGFEKGTYPPDDYPF